VRTPYSNPAHVDPEEAYVAALSSCHLLWFLSLAAGQGYVVESYLDQAEGTMERGESGKLWVARVVLKPHVVFGGARQPSDAAVDQLHHQAHAECYLASSVRSEVRTVGTWEYRALRINSDLA
jgi:organic hydroperoxide reductase OsmC/OhrA